MEEGGSDLYALGLSKLPTGELSVAVVADDQSEVSVDGVSFASSVTVTFDETNGTTLREITVRAVDDTVVE